MVDLFKPIKHRAAKILQRACGIFSDKKEDMLHFAFSAIKSWRINGDYFEFGVYEGRAFIHAYKQSRRIGRNDMRFLAFDSFQGLSTPSKEEGHNRFYKGQYACSREDFIKIISDAGVDISRVDCIEGFFSDSLTYELQNTFSEKKAAIVWIDCDLSQPTLEVLQFITPFLQTGTIICYDDWFCYGGHPSKGELYATNQWMEQKKHINLLDYRNFGVSGKSFVVQKLEES